MVLHQDDVQLDPLGHCGDDLGRHHQVGPVADQHEHLTLQVGQLGPQAAGDLVPHAGVPVLDVVLLRVPGAPQHLQVPGHAPGRLHDHVPVVHQVVQRPEDLGLGRPRLMAEVVGAVNRPLPAGVQLGRPAGIRLVHVPPAHDLGQRLQSGPSLGHQRGTGLLARVEGRDVEVDEPHSRMAEGGPGGGGEVGVAGADAEHHVGLARQRVGHGRAGRADTAHGARMVPGQGALAGLRIRHGDAGGLGEAPQRLAGLGVDDAPARDDERPARGTKYPDGPVQGGGLGHWARHVPGPFGKKIFWPVVSLGLHVLREGQRHGAGFGRVGEHAHRGQQRRGQLLRTPDAVEEP